MPTFAQVMSRDFFTSLESKTKEEFVMVNRVEVRTEEYSGIVCALLSSEDGSIYVEIKESGKKTKRVAKINKYLDMLANKVA
jgi:hypothetical protein